jgi:hypothetical protein
LGTLQRLHDFLKITVKGRMNDEWCFIRKPA